MSKNKKGFTLAELLIVVSVIAILVGITLPIFSYQLEKARRAVDMANVRNIMAVLKNGMNSNDIEFSSKKASYGDYYASIAIVVNKDDMKAYASGNVKIDGKDFASGDNNYSRLYDYLKKCGISGYTLSSKSTNNDGWQYYAVIIYSDGSSRICSGIEDQSNKYEDASNFEQYTDYWKTNTQKSNIEIAMGL